jgi:hypothetical protein
VERTCESWFILSAKHGLLDPLTEIDPYDETLKRKTRAEREAWSDRVLRDLLQRLGTVEGLVVEIHAGSEYRDHGLVDGLRRLGATVSIPTEGMGIGRQLSFYSMHERSNEQ